MARWHDVSCDTPSILCKDGKPRCRSCGKSPDLEALVVQQETVDDLWHLPADEEVGTMSLHWPTSVTYSGKEESQVRSRDDPVIGPTSQKETRKPSTIYEERLPSDQFRLLCLTAQIGEDRPIHVSLETYAYDDYPEYETVSYAWGGEDGDSSKCLPVYIGKYWDVLLQTKNCWSLLKHVRPRRGIRLIWLDAVCINQDDTTEKEMQIARMGMIYQQSLRVVVYLGNDIVRACKSGRHHPRRHYLHECSASNEALQSKLRRMIELRYFRRVWVIQELLLAPNALIAIDEIEFTSGPANGGHGWKWISSKVPWLDFLCNGSSLREKSLFDVLNIALSSEASDPRDKLFGLLGLVSPDMANDLAPDYSISMIHTYIGITSYCILNLKESCTFMAAAGSRSTQQCPSWVSDWEGYRLLGDFRSNVCSFDLPRIQGMPKIHFRWGSSIGSPVLGDMAEVVDGDGEQIVTATNSPNGRYCYVHLHGAPGDAGEISFSNPAGYKISRACSDIEWITWDTHRPRINKRTASLTMDLVHLFRVYARPRRINRFRVRNMEISIFQFRSTNCQMLLTTSHVSFDDYKANEAMDIFALVDKYQEEYLLFFMSKTTDANKYRLVKTCPCYNLTVQYPFESTRPENLRLVIALLRGIHDNFTVEQAPERDLSELGSLVESSLYASCLTKAWGNVESQIAMLGYVNIRDDIRCTLYSQKVHSTSMLGDVERTIHFNSTSRPVNFLVLRQVFLQSSQTLLSILTLIHYLVSADDGHTANFMDDYLIFIYKQHPETRPVLRNNMLYISLPLTARAIFFNRPISENTPYVNIPWEWSINTGDNTKPTSWAPCDMEFDKLSRSMGLPLSEFRLRAPVSRIKNVLRNTLYYEMLSKLSPARRHTGEDELTMLLREPKDEDRYICLNSWPQIVIDEFHAVGKIKSVEII